jgi:hypothetical protein
MQTAKPDYISFLVRLWGEKAPDREWLVQIELIPSREKLYFNSLDDLFAYLRKKYPSRNLEQADKE